MLETTSNGRPAWKRVVLTGAAGRLGGSLRPHIARAYGLRSTDILPIDNPLANEETTSGDLASPDDVARMVAGADAIVHFGGVPVEDTFDNLLPANIIGYFNVFEQARLAGVRRVIFASSNHATGFHPSGEILDAGTPPLPDSLYGVTKVYGEALGAFYAWKYGMEVACLRIGACWPKPRGDLRDLSVWLSHADLARMVMACLEAKAFRYEIIYGVSNNTRSWWTNAKSSIDYRPQDNAEAFVGELTEPDGGPRDREDPAVRFQGGAFAAADYQVPPWCKEG